MRKFAPSLLLATFYLAGVVLAVAGEFQQPFQFRTGNAPNQVAVADLNGDGKPDIVTVNFFDGTVSVLLGNGDGTFPTHVEYRVVPDPSWVVVGDFNGDLKPDLAVTSYEDESASILMGNGDGTFQPHTDFATPKDTACGAAGDFNGDGLQDLAIASPTQNAVAVFLASGNGVFQKYVNYPTGKDSHCVAVGDFNRDGRLDLAVTSPGDHAVSVLIGNGNGTFQQRVQFMEESSPFLIYVADINHDGLADLVAADYFGAAAAYLGNGDGTFQTAVSSPALGGGLAIADFDHDGKLDLASTDLHSVHLARGDGNGKFVRHGSYGVGLFSVSIATGDFNLDGRPDVVTGGGNNNNFVNVLLGSGNGTLQSFTLWRTFRYPWGIAIGDLNKDGKPDIVTGGTLSHDHTISVLLGNGDGTLRRHVDYTAGTVPSTVALADFDHDGNPDVVTANSDATEGNTISILVGKGDGTLRSHLDYPTGKGPDAVAVGDFNGDGKLDVVTANICGTDPICQDHGHGTVSILLGNGDATFQANVDYDTAGLEPSDVALGDFNRDGKLDVAVTNRVSFTVSVLLGNGDGTLQAAVSQATASYPYSVVAADFNHDGNLDLAVGALNHVSVFLGNGDGTLQARNDYDGAQFPISVTAGDFNGDGNIDLATASGSVLLGRGDGTFRRHIDYLVAPDSAKVTVGDFNLDGAPDLAITHSSGAQVGLLLNRGGTRVTATSTPNPSRLGQSVTFTASVTASLHGHPAPKGMVIFKDGNTTLAQVKLQHGETSFSTSSLSVGTHTITISYLGNDNFNPNSAPPLQQVVNP